MSNGSRADGAVVARAPLAAAVVLVMSTLVLAPIASVGLQPSTAFMPALIAAVTIFDLMTAYLLLGDFRDRGDRRSLVMAWAYIWSLTVMTGFALAFPGGVFTDPPLAVTASVAPYLYVTWHCGFPLLLGLAWVPWPARLTRPAAAPVRSRLGVACATTAVAVGAGVVATFLIVIERLPVLEGLAASRTSLILAPAIPLVVLALAFTIRGTWGRTGPERWTSVAVLACLCDLVLGYLARDRFSIGWYGGRTLTIFAAGVVLLAMLASFRQLKAQAERDALMDALTGLINRRGAYAALETIMARHRRAGVRVGVVSFDLDWFKTVNDEDGHEAGDAVLRQVGVVVDEHTRGGDVGARVGGEEFLLLLYDTDATGALATAERLRQDIAAMTVPGVRAPVTASVGVTTVDIEDTVATTVLRRADLALYEAKRNGRNRVEAGFVGVVTTDPEPVG